MVMLLALRQVIVALVEALVEAEMVFDASAVGRAVTIQATAARVARDVGRCMVFLVAWAVSLSLNGK